MVIKEDANEQATPSNPPAGCRYMEQWSETTNGEESCEADQDPTGPQAPLVLRSKSGPESSGRRPCVQRRTEAFYEGDRGVQALVYQRGNDRRSHHHAIGIEGRLQRVLSR